jgi:DNA-binding response OmpR family regulator
LNPSARYQTLSQLLDAIRAARRDVEERERPPGTPGVPAKQLTVFVVEKDDRLMSEMRDGFRRFGYRVLITRDPALALQRFRQQPYDALVVNACTTDVAGREAFDRVLTEVRLRDWPFGGVLLISEEQAEWKQTLTQRNRVTALTLPTHVKKIHKAIGKLLARSANSDSLQPP